MNTGPGVVETHTAVLFFLEDRVYKIKRPVDLGFLDFRTVEARQRACREEVALNRRMAPDVYLGVASVRGEDDQPCESVIVMRRMPEDRRLSSVISTADPTTTLEAVRAVARSVAAFHARSDSSPELAELGSWSAVRRLWEENLDGLQRYSGRILDAALFDRLRVLADSYLRGREPLFRSRQERHLIRDGHGDLLADDIFCLEDGPRILDCLDFDRRYRVCDVLLDVAFLGMDLERLGRPDLARELFTEYARFNAEHHPFSLQHFFVAYRALVRSKVSCIRAEQLGTDGATADQAHQLATLAERHLLAARTRLLLVGGLPGTGKSSVSAGLADLGPGWTLLRSDQVRREVAGIDGPAPAAPGEGLYTSEHRQRTYDELLDRARKCLQQGENVLLDASWVREEDRAAAKQLAGAVGAELIALQCLAPPAVVLDRLARRRGDASDADAAVALAMSRSADPWPEALPLPTDAPLPQVVAAAARLLEA